jgi:hypothetical protein
MALPAIPLNYFYLIKVFYRLERFDILDLTFKVYKLSGSSLLVVGAINL